MSLCEACGHLAYDFSYTEEDKTLAAKRFFDKAAPYSDRASGTGHGFAGDLPCKCGCKQTPRITELEKRIAEAKEGLEKAKQKAEGPWAPYVYSAGSFS